MIELNKLCSDYHYSEGSDEIFQGKERIEIPYIEPSTDAPIPKTISEFCKSNNIKIIDYKKGLVKRNTNSKNVTKLSKYLPESIKKEFVNDINRFSNGKKKKIILTRNLEDLLNMSTGRSWTSCLRRDRRSKKLPRHLKSLLDAECLAVYLVDEDDLEIKKPHGRIVIHQYTNKKEEIIFFPNSVGYGNIPQSFVDSVVKFFVELNKNKFGIFSCHNEDYFEKFTDVEIIHHKSIRETLKRLKIKDFEIDTKNKLIKLDKLKIHGLRFYPGIFGDYKFDTDNIDLDVISGLYNLNEIITDSRNTLNYLSIDRVFNLKTLGTIKDVNYSPHYPHSSNDYCDNYFRKGDVKENVWEEAVTGFSRGQLLSFVTILGNMFS